MRDPARILIADDSQDNRELLRARLEAHGYELLQAADGEEALAQAQQHLPDLILLDVMMPKLDGFEVCRRLKGNQKLPYIPIILVTAKSDSKDIVTGLDAGGDEYLTKPIDHASLVARVRSILRTKALHDQVQAQAAELADWNRTLEERVRSQLAQIEGMDRLKRFLAPQVAELVSRGDDRLLRSHRRDIVAVMCDLRGFTAFAETGEPEDVIALLQDYHQRVVPIVFRYEGTIERFLGDGVLVFFNDPFPCDDPAQRAVRMASDMRSAVREMAEAWRRRGQSIGFGVGIAQGYATIGQVGFEGRVEYSAVGTVMNLAARLSDEAADGQILLSPRVAAAVESIATLSPTRELVLKGISRPIQAFNLDAMRG
ncbi:MAG TPA: response regulator [Rhodospirillales bacterium]|jgi:DNA-binding response OmpR family regulator